MSQYSMKQLYGETKSSICTEFMLAWNTWAWLAQKKALVPLGICLNSDMAICIGTVSALCAGCGYWMS